MATFRGLISIWDFSADYYMVAEEEEIVCTGTNTGAYSIYLPDPTVVGDPENGRGSTFYIKDPENTGTYKIYPPAGHFINGAAEAVISQTGLAITVIYQGDGLWQAIGAGGIGISYLYEARAYVHPDGDDTTGVIGNFNKPFATAYGAWIGLGSGTVYQNNIIHIMPGSRGRDPIGRGIYDVNFWDYTETQTIIVPAISTSLTIHLEAGVKLSYRPGLESEGPWIYGGYVDPVRAIGNCVINITSDDNTSIIGCFGEIGEDLEWFKNAHFATFAGRACTRIENVTIYVEPVIGSSTVNAYGIITTPQSAVSGTGRNGQLVMKNVNMKVNNRFPVYFNQGVTSTCIASVGSDYLELDRCKIHLLDRATACLSTYKKTCISHLILESSSSNYGYCVFILRENAFVTETNVSPGNIVNGVYSAVRMNNFEDADYQKGTQFISSRNIFWGSVTYNAVAPGPVNDSAIQIWGAQSNHTFQGWTGGIAAGGYSIASAGTGSVPIVCDDVNTVSGVHNARWSFCKFTGACLQPTTGTIYRVQFSFTPPPIGMDPQLTFAFFFGVNPALLGPYAGISLPWPPPPGLSYVKMNPLTVTNFEFMLPFNPFADTSPICFLRLQSAVPGGEGYTGTITATLIEQNEKRIRPHWEGRSYCNWEQSVNNPDGWVLPVGNESDNGIIPTVETTYRIQPPFSLNYE